MRKLLWIAIGFCIGCGIAAYIFTDITLLLLMVAAGVAGGILLHLQKKKTALVLFGCGVSLLWSFIYCENYLSPLRKLDGQVESLQVTVADYSDTTRAEGEVRISGRTYSISLILEKKMTLRPGDVLEGSFLLTVTAPGGSGEGSHYQGKGIYLLAYGQEDVTLHPGTSRSLSYLPARLRQKLLSVLDKTFPADTRGFARALLLGDTEKLTYEQDIAFQVSGIRHVVAVSGLHVSILFALIYLFAGKQKHLTAILGIPALFLFAAVAGFTPSIIRACVMQSLMILAMLVRREYDPPSALSFAVLVILFINPLAVASVSFQLSVGCIAGIFLFSGRMQRRFHKYTVGSSLKKRLCRFCLSSLSVTASTMLVTTPLCAYYFGCVSVVSVLTNMLTLFVISFIFYGIMAAAALSVLYLPLGQGIGLVVSVPIRYVLFTAQNLSEIPFAAVYTSSPYIVLWLVFCYGLFFLFWQTGRKHPAGFVTSAAGMLILCITFTCMEPRLDNYRLTVLDVGQGQCVLLQSKGRTYMVDCGGTSDKIAANVAATHLHSQGIFRIDGIILTHYDKDHVGGLTYFLERIAADTVYLPNVDDCPLTLPPGQATEKVEAVTEILCGRAKLTMIPGRNGEVDNETSTCILFQAENCDILITGDRATAGEAYLLEQYDLPDLEVLVAGHHGSNSSTKDQLLDKTKPEIVAISVGEDNHYDHPGIFTLLRLQVRSCRILRTDLHGTILIRG